MLFVCHYGEAQYLGGNYSFAFTRLPNHAPLAALGGINVSLLNNNPNMLLANPALLNTEMNKHVAISYVPYYAGIKNSSVAYVQEFDKIGKWGTALQYMDYGTFEETDPSGNVLGTFEAREYLVSLGHARTIDHYTLGVNLKYAGSVIASYQAHALMMDIGGIFKHPENDWSIGLLIKNAGFAFKNYYSASTVSVPFDVQIGTTFKPKFMPLRFSFTAHHLHQFNIAYDDPDLSRVVNQNGSDLVEKVSFIDKLARHFVIGTQVLLGKNFQLLAGYNHLIRQELKLPNRMAGAGLSFGASLRIKAFEMAYARTYFHAAGGISYLTLTGNLGSVLKKQKDS